MKGRIENPIEGDCLEMEYIFKWRLFGYRKYMEIWCACEQIHPDS